MPETSRDSIIFQTLRVHLPSQAQTRESSLLRMSWLEADTEQKEERGPEGDKRN